MMKILLALANLGVCLVCQVDDWAHSGECFDMNTTVPPPVDCYWDAELDEECVLDLELETNAHLTTARAQCLDCRDAAWTYFLEVALPSCGGDTDCMEQARFDLYLAYVQCEAQLSSQADAIKAIADAEAQLTCCNYELVCDEDAPTALAWAWSDVPAQHLPWK
jgi:hypothetical protein